MFFQALDLTYKLSAYDSDISLKEIQFCRLAVDRIVIVRYLLLTIFYFEILFELLYAICKQNYMQNEAILDRSLLYWPYKIFSKKKHSKKYPLLKKKIFKIISTVSFKCAIEIHSNPQRSPNLCEQHKNLKHLEHHIGYWSCIILSLLFWVFKISASFRLWFIFFLNLTHICKCIPCLYARWLTWMSRPQIV